MSRISAKTSLGALPQSEINRRELVAFGAQMHGRVMAFDVAENRLVSPGALIAENLNALKSFEAQRAAGKAVPASASPAFNL